jgi:hypothetical protein
MSKKHVMTLTAVSGVLLTMAHVHAAPGARLIVNGKVASTNVQIINGQAFVSVKDMAKALGMAVVKNADGSYEIKKAGGTYQVGDLNGKVGDVLFDGKWRFQVVNVRAVDSYKMKTSSEPSSNLYATSEWNATTRTLTPKAGYKLFLVICRVTNGQKTKQTLWTAPSDDKLRTALADMEGGSHPPIAYDYTGGPIQTQPLVPGASLTFPVLFGAPAATQLKDLIFTLKNNDYSAKGNDARVSLTESGEATTTQ